MTWKYGILCLLALIATLLLAFENYETWTGTLNWPVGRDVVRKAEKKQEVLSAQAIPKQTSNIKSFVSIAAKNIFSPERTDFPVVPPPGPSGGADQKAKPVARPQVLLYGITLFGDYQSATVSTPGNPLRKGERETMTIKPGDKVGEYKLSKILPDRITMEAGEDSFEVLLYDPKAPKQRSYVKTEAKPAAVTSALPTQPSPAPAPGIPATAQQPAPGVATPPPAPAPVPRPAGPAIAPTVPPPSVPSSAPVPPRSRRGAGTLIPQSP
jgi:hypothetical protein